MVIKTGISKTSILILVSTEIMFKSGTFSFRTETLIQIRGYDKKTPVSIANSSLFKVLSPMKSIKIPSYRN